MAQGWAQMKQLRIHSIGDLCKAIVIGLDTRS